MNIIGNRRNVYDDTLADKVNQGTVSNVRIKTGSPQDPGNFLRFENLSCVDNDGRVFEKHKEAWMEVEGFLQGEHYTLDVARNLRRKEGIYIPSFALTCQMMQQAHERVDYKRLIRHNNGLFTCDGQPEAKFLLGFLYGNGQICDTVVDWDRNVIIHNGNIELPFERDGNWKKEWRLEEAIMSPNGDCFVQQLTGLSEYTWLLDLAKTFDCTAYLNLPKTQEDYKGKRGTRIGIRVPNNSAPSRDGHRRLTFYSGKVLESSTGFVRGVKF